MGAVFPRIPSPLHHSSSLAICTGSQDIGAVWVGTTLSCRPQNQSDWSFFDGCLKAVGLAAGLARLDRDEQKGGSRRFEVGE